MKRSLAQTTEGIVPKRPKTLFSFLPIPPDLIEPILSLAWTPSNHRSLALSCKRIHYALFGNKELCIPSLLLKIYTIRHALTFELSEYNLYDQKWISEQLREFIDRYAIYIPCVSVYDLLAKQLDKRMAFVHVVGTINRMKINLIIGSRLTSDQTLLQRCARYHQSYYTIYAI